MDTVSWLSYTLLGVFHGINPGMGWLFAVALGMQEKRRSAVIGALFPMALGHAISIGVVVLVIALAQQQIQANVLHIACAVILFGFGVYKLFRARHPRWVGMRVNFKELNNLVFPHGFRARCRVNARPAFIEDADNIGAFWTCPPRLGNDDG